MPVKLLVSARVAVPALIGWLRPVILLPPSVLAELPPEHLELILAHELAHLRRCDYLLNLLQTAIETLLFYHPAVWWVSYQIRMERESCCDEQVTATGNRLSYARALTALAELCREPRRLGSSDLALRADGGSFSARIRRVLKRPESSKAATPAWLGGLAALVLIAAMAATMAWAGKASNNEAAAETASTSRKKQRGRRPRPVQQQSPSSLAGSVAVPLSEEQRTAIARQIADVLDKAVAEHAEDAAVLAKLPFGTQSYQEGKDHTNRLMTWPAAIQSFRVSPDAKYNAACVQAAAKYLDDKRPQYRAAVCELLAYTFPCQIVDEGLLPRIAGCLGDFRQHWPGGTSSWGSETLISAG